MGEALFLDFRDLSLWFLLFRLRVEINSSCEPEPLEDEQRLLGPDLLTFDDVTDLLAFDEATDLLAFDEAIEATDDAALAAAAAATSASCFLELTSSVAFFSSYSRRETSFLDFW